MKHHIIKSITAVIMAVLMTAPGILPVSTVTVYADTLSDAESKLKSAEKDLEEAKDEESQAGIRWLDTVTIEGNSHSKYPVQKGKRYHSPICLSRAQRAACAVNPWQASGS